MNKLPPNLADNHAYHELVRRRQKLSILLSLIMLVSYVGFILLIAFKPTLLGTPIAEGSPITLGIPIGLGLILLAMGITGIYVRVSNKVFDALTDAARESAGLK
ncbi:MAG: DUF485 domain-containing protein [Alphaproteobacteria bacterium]|nr:MAG: DUF485 domain-containing protein [Alphaproteobacteria bacterium]